MLSHLLSGTCPLLLLALVAGCDEALSPAVDRCAGGELADLRLGQGNGNFVPWFDGDEIPLEESAGYGFWLTLQTIGLDTREPMTTSVEFVIGAEEPVTVIEVPVSYACQDDGGNATVFATLSDALQSAEAVADLHDEALEVLVIVTDGAGHSASSDLELVVEALWLTGAR